MGSDSKIFTFEDVAKHNNRQDCWLIVNGKVYDVTSYLDEHPGGDDALLTSTGKDATNDFEDVGHSKSARKLMEKYLVGEVDTSTLPKTANKFNSQPASTPASAPAQALDTNNQSPGFAVKILQFMLPLLILALAFAMQYSGKESKSN